MRSMNNGCDINGFKLFISFALYVIKLSEGINEIKTIQILQIYYHLFIKTYFRRQNILVQIFKKN